MRLILLTVAILSLAPTGARAEDSRQPTLRQSATDEEIRRLRAQVEELQRQQTPMQAVLPPEVARDWLELRAEIREALQLLKDPSQVPRQSADAGTTARVEADPSSNPWSIVGVGFLAGILIGGLITRRQERSRRGRIRL